LNSVSFLATRSSSSSRLWETTLTMDAGATPRATAAGGDDDDWEPLAEPALAGLADADEGLDEGFDTVMSRSILSSSPVKPFLSRLARESCLARIMDGVDACLEATETGLEDGVSGGFPEGVLLPAGWPGAGWWPGGACALVGVGRAMTWNSSPSFSSGITLSEDEEERDEEVARAPALPGSTDSTAQATGRGLLAGVMGVIFVDLPFSTTTPSAGLTMSAVTVLIRPEPMACEASP
jgi:hypothetical protein